MRKVFLLLLIAASPTTKAQNNIAGKYIILSKTYAVAMRNTTNDDLQHFYNFGDTLTTKGGRYVCPAVNYIYFQFPDKVAVEKLPIDSFRPAPTIVNTITPR